jgi:hypothetical protein
VNVTDGDVAFKQTAVVPEIDAVGKGFTVTVTLPVEVQPLTLVAVKT